MFDERFVRAWRLYLAGTTRRVPHEPRCSSSRSSSRATATTASRGRGRTCTRRREPVSRCAGEPVTSEPMTRERCRRTVASPAHRLTGHGHRLTGRSLHVMEPLTSLIVGGGPAGSTLRVAAAAGSASTSWCGTARRFRATRSAPAGSRRTSSPRCELDLDAYAAERAHLSADLRLSGQPPGRPRGARALRRAGQLRHPALRVRSLSARALRRRAAARRAAAHARAARRRTGW